MELRARILGGRKPLNFDRMSGEQSLLAQFRLDEKPPTPRNGNLLQISDYLLEHGDLSEGGVRKALTQRAREAEGPIAQWRYKRAGPDEDDAKWLFSKIHGLENIALVSDEDLLATAGDPFALQELVHAAADSHNPAASAPHSFEESLREAHERLATFKDTVSTMELHDSNRKKLLALPFALARRTQTPEPKRGQWQWDFFRELHGKSWDQFDSLRVDPEKKIVDWENFLDEKLVQHYDTESAGFKAALKRLYLNSSTEYETHMANRKSFSALMPLFASLDVNEARSLMHLLQSQTAEKELDAMIGIQYKK